MAVQGCGPKLAKMLLFVFNFLLLLAGAALLGVGSYVMVKQDQYEELFSEDSIVIVSGITIGVGCFTFFISFCGCCGAMKENVCLLKSYFAFILLIILLEIVAGIMTFVYADEIENSMNTGMTNTIRDDYGLKDGATKAVDDVQETFKCCGATNYSDYIMSKGLKPGKAVPESCCVDRNNATVVAYCQMGPKGQPTYPDYVWSYGCVEESISSVKDHYWILAIVILCLLVFEIFTMIFACCVINGIQKGYETV